VFIGIFPSSKTVITGAVNWAEVDDAYDFASRLLLQNFEEVCIPTHSKIFTQNTKMEGLTHELAASASREPTSILIKCVMVCACVVCACACVRVCVCVCVCVRVCVV
jgi:hypothetical protein